MPFGGRTAVGSSFTCHYGSANVGRASSIALHHLPQVLLPWMLECRLRWTQIARKGPSLGRSPTSRVGD
jgi:hypothetical protein